MPTTWILSANAGRVRIFAESSQSEPLQEIEDMVNTAAQLRTSETETDRIGPLAAANSSHAIGGNEAAGFAHNAKAGAPTSGYEPNQTPAEHQTELFAKDVSTYLLKAQQEGRFQQLVISASPEFLGVLRSKLDPQVKQAVKLELNKDYTHSNAHQLREQLQAQQAKAE